MAGKAAKVQQPRLSAANAEPVFAPSKQSAGYMLLDLALALTVVLLLFTLVWPLMGRGTSNAHQAAIALDIATLLRADRSAATSDGVRVGTRFDLGRRMVVGAGGRVVHVPGDIAVTVTTSAQCAEGIQRFAIVFAPDGTSCGGVVTLTKGALSYAVKINWLSGMVDVVNGPQI
jgi:general secretion pathway protein H